MRKKIAENSRKDKELIVWRGNETQRIEAFSDSVFAFALTLLIVSLEVPKSFGQLGDVLSGFFIFGLCFILLFQVWYCQNLFFRRYGLHDIKTIVLNGALLFTVLFYVYPLKFLFSLFAVGTKLSVSILPQEVPTLMLIYGLGFCAIFLLFAYMYANAAKNAEELNLTELEVFETHTHKYVFLSFVAVGIIAIVIAFIVPPQWAGPTGAVYGLTGLGVSMVTSRRKKIREKRFQA